MQIITKIFNEEPINPNKFQIIPITSEMKAKYPALKKYNELIVSGKQMSWYDAMDYAKKNRAVLPDREEGKDIAKLIKNSGWTRYFWFWTREEYSYDYSYDNAFYINNLGEAFDNNKISYFWSCICLR